MWYILLILAALGQWVWSVHRAAWPRYFPDSANTMETAGRDAAGGRDLFRGRVRKTRLEEGGRNNRQPGPGEETTWTIFTFYTPRGMKTATKKMQACPECGQRTLFPMIKTDLFYAALSFNKSEKISSNRIIKCLWEYFRVCCISRPVHPQLEDRD